MSANFSDKDISFSRKVKTEIMKVSSNEKHCLKAELAAIKYFTLVSNTIKISTDNLKDLDLLRECCKKAFLRGAFLAAGRINDPNKSNHFEIASEDEVLVKKVFWAFDSLGISPKKTRRKQHHVVYIKDGATIVDVLGLLGAPISLMDYENIRILKEMRNDLNRKVNCEAANIQKTISAALMQIDDIKYIDEKVGLSELPSSLQEVAKLRRKYPEASLSELGGKLNPPVGKSGINHRLRRITRFAENMRKEGR